MLPGSEPVCAIFCSATEIFGGQDSALASVRFKFETQSAGKDLCLFCRRPRFFLSAFAAIRGSLSLKDNEATGLC
jgi:hypothetical protein